MYSGESASCHISHAVARNRQKCRHVCNAGPYPSTCQCARLTLKRTSPGQISNVRRCQRYDGCGGQSDGQTQGHAARDHHGRELHGRKSSRPPDQRGWRCAGLLGIRNHIRRQFEVSENFGLAVVTASPSPLPIALCCRSDWGVPACSIKDVGTVTEQACLGRCLLWLYACHAVGMQLGAHPPSCLSVEQFVAAGCW